MGSSFICRDSTAPTYYITIATYWSMYVMYVSNIPNYHYYRMITLNEIAGEFFHLPFICEHEMLRKWREGSIGGTSADPSEDASHPSVERWWEPLLPTSTMSTSPAPWGTSSFGIDCGQSGLYCCHRLCDWRFDLLLSWPISSAISSTRLPSSCPPLEQMPETNNMGGIEIMKVG